MHPHIKVVDADRRFEYEIVDLILTKQTELSAPDSIGIVALEVICPKQITLSGL